MSAEQPPASSIDEEDGSHLMKKEDKESINQQIKNSYFYSFRKREKKGVIANFWDVFYNPPEQTITKRIFHPEKKHLEQFEGYNIFPSPDVVNDLNELDKEAYERCISKLKKTATFDGKHLDFGLLQSAFLFKPLKRRLLLSYFKAKTFFIRQPKKQEEEQQESSTEAEQIKRLKVKREEKQEEPKVEKEEEVDPAEKQMFESIAEKQKAKVQKQKDLTVVEVALDDMDPRDKIAICRFMELGDSMYTLLLMVAVGLFTSKVHFWNKMNNFNNMNAAYKNSSFIYGRAYEKVGAWVLSFKHIFPYRMPYEVIYLPMQVFFFIVLGMKLRYNQRKDLFMQEAVAKYEKLGLVKYRSSRDVRLPEKKE